MRFPTGVTILRVIAVARWLAWGWMVAVVAFSGDAVRQPIVAWAVAGAVLVERAVGDDERDGVDWGQLRQTWR